MLHIMYLAYCCEFRVVDGSLYLQYVHVSNTPIFKAILYRWLEINQIYRILRETQWSPLQMGPCTTKTCLKLSVWMYIIILRSCPIIIAVVLFCLCHRTLAPYQHRMQPYYASSPPHMVPAIARMPVHPKLNKNQGI